MQNFVGQTANFVKSWEKIRNISKFEGGGSGIFVRSCQKTESFGREGCKVQDDGQQVLEEHFGREVTSFWRK